MTNALAAKLEQNPQLAEEVKEFIEKREQKQADDQYLEPANSEPKYVFESDESDRKPDSMCTVKNRFGDIRGGQIKRKITNVAYLVVVDDQTIVVHEPNEAW